MAEASIDTTGRALVASADRLEEAGWGWAFIDQAALGRNGFWRYLVALLRIVLYPLAVVVLVTFIAVWTTRQSGQRPPPMAMVIAAFGYLIAGGVAVVQSVARTHRRPWLSVVTPSLALDWRRLAIGAGVQAALTLPLLILGHWLNGRPWRLNATLPVVAIALLLTPLQAASEEIIFRGYLTQALGRVFRSRVKIVVAVAILFAALHWNQYGPLTMPYIFVVSVIFSLVSLRDGRLELTIGAHTAWNWVGVSEIGLLLSGHSTQIRWPYFVALFIQGALFYGLTRFFVRRVCERNRPGVG